MVIAADLIAAAKTCFDLTEKADRESLQVLADAWLAAPSEDQANLSQAAAATDAALELRLAARLVDSRQWMLSNRRPLRIAVVFAMWGEHHRLLPKTPSNPHGEDALRVKIAQLNWACAGTPIEWQLYAVDDGCPHGSARIATEIAAETDAPVQVLDLAATLPTDIPPLSGLSSADASRKAGAIMLGCRTALDQGAEAVLYTDADNSVHLGQIGTLLQPHLESDRQVVLGDRKHADAVPPPRCSTSASTAIGSWRRWPRASNLPRSRSHSSIPRPNPPRSPRVR